MINVEIIKVHAGQILPHEQVTGNNWWPYILPHIQ